MDHGEPASYLTLAAGVPVYSRDGQRLGEVEHVLGDPDADIFDGIVFDASPLPGGHRFVDAPDVDEIYERGVVLKLDAGSAERPTAPGPTRPRCRPPRTTSPRASWSASCVAPGTGSRATTRGARPRTRPAG